GVDGGDVGHPVQVQGQAVRELALQRDQGIAHQVGPADVLERFQRVARWKHGHEGQVEQGVGRQLGQPFAVGADADVHFAAHGLGDGVFDRTVQQVDLDVGVVPAEAGDDFRDQGAGHQLGSGDAHDAAPQALEVVDVFERAVQ